MTTETTDTEAKIMDQTITNSSHNSEAGEETCDQEKEEGDNVEELDPDHLEERFRVDRRKLEQMIQSNGKGETAEDFFLRIMTETDTHITWPSKLKIGAKSKKDPHIKISGHKDRVADAKVKVMLVLDTKSTRVTLKMDVSYTEHSHVIGKGGNNIKHVMQQTGCHIHFPDSNRSNQAEKSNQVSIAGQPQGVEQARTQIRDLLPLVFMFELPMTGLLQPLDASSPPIKTLQDNYGVTVTFKQRPHVYMCTVVVRGTVSKAKSVKEATVRLIEQLTGSIGTSAQVNLQLEIAPQHHLSIMGRGGVTIKQIMQLTGAVINFPDAATSQTARKSSVILSGPIDSVCLARQHLIGCLPLVLMFDMKEESEIDQAKLTQLMEQLDVFISIKPKPKQPSKSVIVKSIERNALNLYEARRRLLGEEGEQVPVVRHNTSGFEAMHTNALNNMANMGLLGHPILNAAGSPVLLLNGRTNPAAAAAARARLSNLVTAAPPGTCLYPNPNVVLVPSAGGVPTINRLATTSAAQPALLRQPPVFINGHHPQQRLLPVTMPTVPVATTAAKMASVSITAQPADITSGGMRHNNSRKSLASGNGSNASSSSNLAELNMESHRGMSSNTSSPEINTSRSENDASQFQQSRQVSVSVEAPHAAITQMQKQAATLQQLQEQVAAMQRDINQNVRKTQHSPQQMASPSRGRPHSTSNIQQPIRNVDTSSHPMNGINASPPESPPTNEMHHHNQQVLTSQALQQPINTHPAIHQSMTLPNTGGINMNGMPSHQLHHSTSDPQIQIHHSHNQPPPTLTQHSPSIDELLRNAQTNLSSQQQIEEFLRNSQLHQQHAQTQNTPMQIPIEELLRKSQQSQQTMNKHISVEDLLRQAQQQQTQSHYQQQQQNIQQMENEVRLEDLFNSTAQAAANKEAMEELLRKMQQNQQQINLQQQQQQQISVEELLRHQQSAMNQFSNGNMPTGSLDMGTTGSAGAPLPSMAEIQSSLALCNSTLNDLIYSNAANPSIVNSQLSANPQFELSALMAGRGGVDLSATGLPQGSSILDVLLPKLHMSPTGAPSNPHDTSEYLQQMAGVASQTHLDHGEAPPPAASPDHQLLRSGSPQFPAHPPDSPLPPGAPDSDLDPRLGATGTILDDSSAPAFRNFAFQNGRVSPNHGSDSESPDALNRPNVDQVGSLFVGTPLFESIDYEKKKLEATKAMAKKPVGESRVPTDYWSGMGFSKSMPDKAIREQLRANNVKYKGPSMATAYENGDSELAEEEEEDRDPWRDSPRNSPSNSFNAGLRQHRGGVGAHHSPSLHIQQQPNTPPAGSTQPQSPLASPEYSPKRTVNDYGGGSMASPQSMQSVDWPTTDMAELFSELGLGKYTYLFQEQEIDMGTFLTLTDLDLKELGISTFGARRKMLLAIDDLNKRQTPISAAPGSNNPFRKTDKHMHSRRHDIASQSGRW